ncbi:hypothetical protein [Mangrovicoccus sp. HB161399]|uniref:hypothetical protein n=1 Tax=Mangrovicoccus sp. HB161399 TaxID=2720392 RepID=UPI00155572F3|nr:hypothetical protein [Mangrovicoccus sp. HB161399]
MNSKFAAIAALAIAATGFAATANASDQLARSIGVQPGLYSTSQLVQLREAIEDGDSARVAFIVDGPSAAADPSAQLATSLGVAPGSLSSADLAALKSAVEQNKANRIAALTAPREIVSRDAAAASENSQLAAALGVAPGTHDTATLAALYLEATGAGDD